MTLSQDAAQHLKQKNAKVQFRMFQESGKDYKERDLTIMIIIIIALKGAIQDFRQSPYCATNLSPTRKL